MYKTLVIENEYVPRKAVIEALGEKPDVFQCLGYTDNVPEAIDLISQNEYDLIFADIVLNEGNVFDIIEHFRNNQKEMPPVVLFTAHREFNYSKRAVNDFHKEIIHILEKPFWKEWDEHAKIILHKLKELSGLSNTSIKSVALSVNTEFLTIRSSGEQFYYKMPSIAQIYSDGRGRKKIVIQFIDKTKKEFNNTTLAKLLNKLNRNFVQVHRSIIINLYEVESVHYGDGVITLKNGMKCSLGDAFRDNFRNVMNQRTCI